MDAKHHQSPNRAPAILLLAAIASTTWYFFATPEEHEGFLGPGPIALSFWIVYVMSLVEHAWRKYRRPPRTP